jgi:hypothetical protein
VVLGLLHLFVESFWIVFEKLLHLKGRTWRCFSNQLCGGLCPFRRGLFRWRGVTPTVSSLKWRGGCGGDASVKLSCKMFCVAHCNCVDVKLFFFPALVRRRLLSDEEPGQTERILPSEARKIVLVTRTIVAI